MLKENTIIAEISNKKYLHNSLSVIVSTNDWRGGYLLSMKLTIFIFYFISSIDY